MVVRKTVLFFWVLTQCRLVGRCQHGYVNAYMASKPRRTTSLYCAQFFCYGCYRTEFLHLFISLLISLASIFYHWFWDCFSISFVEVYKVCYW
jgi:hypothetical protein